MVYRKRTTETNVMERKEGDVLEVYSYLVVGVSKVTNSILLSLETIKVATAIFDRNDVQQLE